MHTVDQALALAARVEALKATTPLETRQAALILRSEVERLRTWQPMDSVPRNGTEVLLRVERRAGIPGCCLVGHYMPGGHCIEDHPPIDEGWYFWTGGMFDLASKPIAWMPISEAAEAAEDRRIR